MKMEQALLPHKQPCVANDQTLPALHVVDNKVSAAYAIAQIRTMLGQNRAALAYNRLTQSQQHMICCAAGLPERDKKERFEQFAQEERAAIYHAVKQMAKVASELSCFSLSEFNK